MNKADYEPCYRVLGLSADADWDAVRTAYRRLAQRFHPDRHNQGDIESEDRFKEINNAFRLLSTYYREHGRLPGRDGKTREELLRPRYRRESRRSATRAQWVSNVPDGAGGHYRWRRLVAVLIVAGAGGWLLLDKGDTGGDGIAYEPPSPAVRDDMKAVESLDREVPLFFSYGATKEDVLAIQGKPSRKQGEVWYYGQSRVYFKDGVVVNWEIDLSDPLRIRLERKTPDLGPRFTYGATKAEVRVIEGVPNRATDRVWEYGLSRVYFDQGVVVGWESNPLRPLRVYE